MVETETGEGGVRQKSVQVCTNPYTCPYCGSKYKNYSSVANAATAIWQHCSTCAKDNLRVSDAGPTMPAFKMKIRDTISVMEAKMTANGGLDFEPLSSGVPGFSKLSQSVSEGVEGWQGWKTLWNQCLSMAIDRKWTDVQSTILASMVQFGAVSARIRTVSCIARSMDTRCKCTRTMGNVDHKEQC